MFNTKANPVKLKKDTSNRNIIETKCSVSSVKDLPAHFVPTKQLEHIKLILCEAKFVAPQLVSPQLPIQTFRNDIVKVESTQILVAGSQNKTLTKMYSSHLESSCDFKSIDSLKHNEKKTKTRIYLPNVNIKLSAHAKLYIILGTFLILWLPFCVLWPVNSVSPDLIPQYIYQISYWMG